jgi:predicted esterase
MKKFLFFLFIALFTGFQSRVFSDETKVDSPLAGSIGSYQTSFKEFSPLAHTDEMFKRLLKPAMEEEYFHERKAEYSGGAHNGYAFDVKDEIWNIYVPSTYKPGEKYGLFVWINADDNGAPTGNWKKVFAQKKLIFVGADRSGNDHESILRRVALALHSVHNMKKLYNIDDNRIYVSGYSGGGRISSRIAIGYPDIFSGALYICGCNAPNSENVKIPPKILWQKAKSHHRYVFLTGDNDMNREDTKYVIGEYKKLKVHHTKYIQVPGMGHDIPNDEWLGKAIDFLDASPKNQAAQKAPSYQTQSLPPLKLKFN